ncbi:ABC transporter substrate-binding protein [Pelagibacterium xiamenense]|uniref:ABC transporter substrate-binding protein n=1 Tax=Pelagibacterium xiamenense TaxID=2901140 RepID=UPI001E2BC030|nr:ABC transporter substrate-binding protein [Pelagibacterium xiamenense]MCD7061394.1 ABC transporter substrate-binding protein [Pelagibacterium xiamenense]
MSTGNLISTLAAGVAGIALMTGMAHAQSDEPFRLIVTHLEPPLVPNSVMDLALELGYFEAEDVEVELVRVQQTPSALAALQAGEGEMANVGVDALLQIINAGATDFRAVNSPNKSLPFLIAAKEEIATPADLAGASFGVGRVGSLDHSLSTLVLSSLGVDIDDAELVTLGQPSVRAQALAAGQVDATTMSIGVWSELPDQTGLHVLVDQDTYYEGAPVVNKVNAVPGNVLEERPEDVEAVIRALTRLSRDFAQDPQMWIDAMADARPDVDIAVLEMLAQSFASSWSVNGGMSASELAYTVDWLYQTEDFAGQPRLAMEDWVAFGPLDAVLEDLGVDETMDPADR